VTATVGQIDVIGVSGAALVSAFDELRYAVSHPRHACAVGIGTHAASNQLNVFASSADYILGVETGDGFGTEEFGVDYERKSVWRLHLSHESERLLAQSVRIADIAGRELSERHFSAQRHAMLQFSLPLHHFAPHCILRLYQVEVYCVQPK